MQAVKDADAVAFRRALPKQLEMCGELLKELSELPGGHLFQDQWVRKKTPLFYTKYLKVTKKTCFIDRFSAVAQR